MYLEALHKIISFAQFTSDMNIHNTNGWRCTDEECCGSGKIYDPDDPRDSYEGNKLRHIIRCQICDGKGYDDKFEKRWKEIHKNKMNLYRKWNANTRVTNALKKSALKKLTKEEIEVLGL